MTELVLAEVLVLVTLMTVAVLIWGARALPWTTAAEQAGRDREAAASAAERAVLAFLDIDYRNIDERTQDVLNLSTGQFREQFGYRATDLRVATMRARSISKGTIREVAVNRVKGSTARVLIGADSLLRNTGTEDLKATKDCPHAGAQCNRYRFLVTLQRAGDRWLMSDLAEVP